LREGEGRLIAALRRALAEREKTTIAMNGSTRNTNSQIAGRPTARP
jgi:hypothetical protein